MQRGSGWESTASFYGFYKDKGANAPKHVVMSLGATRCVRMMMAAPLRALGRKLTLKEMWSLAEDLVKGVGYLHRGFLVGDEFALGNLHPDNILVGFVHGTPQFKIGGVVEAYFRRSVPAADSDASLYPAPELLQAGSSTRPTTVADIMYSFGVMMAETVVLHGMSEVPTGLNGSANAACDYLSSLSMETASIIYRCTLPDPSIGLTPTESWPP